MYFQFLNMYSILFSAIKTIVIIISFIIRFDSSQFGFDLLK